ncbi:MAG: polyprenyl synthetase family protein [Candidatus Binatia bacterium]
MNLPAYLARRQQRIDRFLERCIAPAAPPDKLTQAMRYSVFSGGKRLRPILALAASEAVGGTLAATLPFACALELIHTYSLIHDDLPAMDDDELRRGRPANHIVFGEGMAILAGDALLTEAFRIMAQAAAKPTVLQRRALQVLAEIAEAAGARGMVAGQAADLAAENARIDLPTVEMIHIRKTGALIRTAVRTGAWLGGARPEQLRRLTRYAESLGLAFQIADDILDAESTTAVTGKTVRRDQARHKATFPALLGLSATKDRARELLHNATRELRAFDRRAEPLRAIAEFVVGRACST